MSDHEELVGRIANLSGQVVGLWQERDLATRLIEQLRIQAKIDVATLNHLNTELRNERALADDLAAALNDASVAMIEADVSPPPQAHRALVRYREARK